MMEGERAAREAERQRLENERLELENARSRQTMQSPAPAPHPAPQEQDSVMVRVNRSISKRIQYFPDFEKVAFNQDIRITRPMIEFMADSQYAADVFYFLGKHPDESAAISVMSPPDMARRLTQIEMQIKADLSKNTAR